MGSFGAIAAISALVLGQTIPVTVYIPKDAKLPGAFKLKDLPAKYHAYTIKTGSDGIGALLPLMLQAGRPDQQTGFPSMVDLLSVSYTAGETVVSEGTEYLVTYVPSLSRVSSDTAGGPGQTQLELTFIRKDRIVSYGPREDLDTANLMKAAPAEMERARPDVAAMNMKQIGLAVSLYASDYDDVFPATESTADLQEVTLPYLKDAKLWRSHNQNGGRILYNTKLAGISGTAIEKPSETVVLFDEKPWTDDRRCVCFVDGHTAFLPEPEFRRLIAIKWPNFPRKMIKITGVRHFPGSVLQESATAMPIPPPPHRQP